MQETQIKGESLNIVSENVQKLKELFPEIVTEDKIDFDILKTVLGNYVEDDSERYNFTWKGKAEALRLAQTPSTGTLRPCKEESKNWDTTENLYIEGDNLEVLKLLQKSYYGKVKMIYIDPPYNTGKEFLYQDNYEDNIQNYLGMTGQIDTNGNKFSTNTDSSGRYHTNWLNMMYPRLRLARNLLNDKGVIFISIDDNEVDNLKKICNEVFGEENFVAQLIWNTEGHTDNQFHIKVNHEYILVYLKNIQFKDESIGYVIDPNVREGSNLWKGYAENSITKNGDRNPPSMVVLPKGFPSKTKKIFLKKNIPPNEFFVDIDNTGYISRELTKKFNVEYPIRLDDMNIEKGELVEECRVYSGWANLNKLKEFIQATFEPLNQEDGNLSFYLSKKGVIYYKKDREKARNILSVLRNMSTTEQMRSYLERNGIKFQYPKPMELIKYLIKIGCETEGIVLDFFSGSGTTSHALFELNKEDNVRRNFISIQLPEKILDNNNFDTISFLGKERISRVGDNILSEINQNGQSSLDFQQETQNTLDVGFKFFKLDSSNLSKWDPEYENIEQSLLDSVENLVTGRSELDLIYEIMLKYGIDLTLPIEEFKVNDGKIIYSIGFGALLICLSENLNVSIANEILKLKEELSPEIMRVVFKDNGFATDSDKTNIKETLKTHGIDEFVTI